MQVVVKSQTSKLVKCEMVSQAISALVQNSAEGLTLHTVKPGFLISGKVAKIFENGLELTYLGGMTGTIFVDHLDKDSIAKYKIGEKVQARVISVDASSKTITLSLLPSIISLTTNPLVYEVKIGQIFQNVKVEKILYGSSFLVNLGHGGKGFLHKSHCLVEQAEEQLDEPEEKKVHTHGKRPKNKPRPSLKKPDYKDQAILNVGEVIDKIRVKELNYFDGLPVLTMRGTIVGSSALDYASLQVGGFVKATIDSINQARGVVTLQLNDFVKGQLTLEHMAEHPVKTIPHKLAVVGKEIKVRVFNVDGRAVEFTKKETLMKEKTPVYAQ